MDQQAAAAGSHAGAQTGVSACLSSNALLFEHMCILQHLFSAPPYVSATSQCTCPLFFQHLATVSLIVRVVSSNLLHKVCFVLLPCLPVQEYSAAADLLGLQFEVSEVCICSRQVRCAQAAAAATVSSLNIPVAGVWSCVTDCAQPLAPRLDQPLITVIHMVTQSLLIPLQHAFHCS